MRRWLGPTTSGLFLTLFALVAVRVSAEPVRHTVAVDGQAAFLETPRAYFIREPVAFLQGAGR